MEAKDTEEQRSNSGDSEDEQVGGDTLISEDEDTAASANEGDATHLLPVTLHPVTRKAKPDQQTNVTAKYGGFCCQ
jgi:hypothetical protein